jgi:hypothetical protein
MNDVFRILHLTNFLARTYTCTNRKTDNTKIRFPHVSISTRITGESMKLKMIAALFAAALPLSASADTGVQLYGIVDLAMAREDADAPGVASRTAMHAGRDSSRFGLRGTACKAASAN